MVRNAIAIALAGALALSAPAFAASAQSAGSKAAAVKVNRAAAEEGRSNELAGGTELLLLVAFGVVTIAAVASAVDDSEEAVSP